MIFFNVFNIVPRNSGSSLRSRTGEAGWRPLITFDLTRQGHVYRVRCIDGEAFACVQHAHGGSERPRLPTSAQRNNHRPRRLVCDVITRLSCTVWICTDGSLKFWEVDTGQHAATIQQHKGWVADLYYWYSSPCT